MNVQLDSVYSNCGETRITNICCHYLATLRSVAYLPRGSAASRCSSGCWPSQVLRWNCKQA